MRLRRIVWLVGSFIIFSAVVTASCGPESPWPPFTSYSQPAVSCERAYDPGLTVRSTSSEWHVEIGEVGRHTTDLALYVEGRNFDLPYAMYPTGWGTWKVVSGQGALPIRGGHLIRLVAYDGSADRAAEYDWLAYLQGSIPTLSVCADGSGSEGDGQGDEGNSGDEGGVGDGDDSGDEGGTEDGDTGDGDAGGVPIGNGPCEWDPDLRVGRYSSEWWFEIEELARPRTTVDIELYVRGSNDGRPFVMLPTGWGTWYVVGGQGAYPIRSGSQIRLVAVDGASDAVVEYDWYSHLVEPLPSPSCDDLVCVPHCDGTHCGGDGCGGTCACPDGHHCDGGVCAATPPPSSGLRVLFIGNSFTHMGPVPDCFRDLAVDGGWARPDVRLAAGSGATLEQHRADPATVREVDGGGWDVVVLQEHSLRPTDNAGSPARFKADATWLYDRIKARSPNATVVLYQTWARHPDHDIYPTTFSSFQQMNNQLRFHYEDAAYRYIPANSAAQSRNDIVVAPVGDVWAQHLFGTSPKVPIYDSFGYHADPYGQYLNALVIYKTVYGARDTVGLTNRCGWYSGATLEARSIEILQRDADHFMRER